MMNIIRVRQEERQIKIGSICETIKLSLDDGKVIDYKHFILATKVGLNLSEATTKDYVGRALFNLGIKPEDLSDEKFVKIWSSTKDKPELTAEEEVILNG